MLLANLWLVFHNPNYPNWFSKHFCNRIEIIMLRGKPKSKITFTRK